jgi:diguanylate cyclase (GGDEF)-like protein/PAS domain S-box-containing protein
MTKVSPNHADISASAMNRLTPMPIARAAEPTELQAKRAWIPGYHGFSSLPAIWRGAVIAVILWSVLVALSLLANTRIHYKNARQQAHNTAMDHFRKDLAFRLWATQRGGLYVESTDDTPPIHYLDFLADRDITSSSGKRLTLYDPASALRHLTSQHGDLYGIPSRIVSPTPFNPANKPDAWEARAIAAFRRGETEISEIADYRGEPHLRIMQPVRTLESCMKCHAQQGYKVGDLNAAVGVAVSLKEFNDTAAHASMVSAASHGGFWLIGLIGIGFGTRRLRQQWQENQEHMAETNLAAQVFENGLQAVIITDAQARIVRVNGEFTQLTGYTAEEAIGQTPAILKSGRHDATFYKAMWRALLDEGRWVGEIWNRRKNGEIFTILETVSTVRDKSGNVLYFISMFQDITEQKEVNDHIYMLAHYDGLTLLPNRQLMSDRIKHAIERARRQEQILALLFIDLDHFKKINDTLGHGAGDRLLSIAAKRLLNCVRTSDTVARLGGDEFAILVEDVDDPADIERIAEKVLQEISTPIELEEREWYVGASIGISIFPKDGDDLGMLLKNADTAMYRAKQEGRNRLCFFDETMAEQAALRLTMETAMRMALDREAFTLHYQPQVDIASGQVVGVEALIRWRRNGQLVPPGEFISLAEDTGLIVPMGQWMIATACREILSLCRELGRNLRLAVNISAREIVSPNFLDDLCRILEQTGMPLEWLELEITESIAMHDITKTAALLKKVSELGMTIAIDDFGTGHSSLAYLKQLPVDFLKIDRTFVRDTPGDKEDSAIVRTIITMSRTLGVRVIAEGVETAEQLDFLRQEGCDLAQGFHLSKPICLDELKSYLRQHDTG